MFDRHRNHRKSRVTLLSFFAAAVAALLVLAQPAGAQPAPGQPPVAAKPPALVPLEQAFLRAATTLFESIPAGQEKTVIVIDPLVDGVTGIQSVATRGFDRRIAQLVAERYRHIEIAPLTPESIGRARYVFIGTFNTINNAGQPTGPRDAFWICFALVDQQSKTVHARSVARATLSDVDIAPASFFADTPVWGLDSATTAYIETCQRSKPGDPVSPAYLDQLPAAARIREATVAYEAGDARRALALYREVQERAPGEQLRALNGVYLSLTALGEKEEASKAFAQLVEGGLKLGRLGVLFLFESGTTDFNSDARVSAQYPDWLGEIARRAGEANACLQVVGHASRTGTEPFNERLSLDRAQRIVTLLAERAPGLAARLKSAGSGSREVLVGLPRDDASTALDRRVEFKPASCV
jgi:outer membrane protein OmpA-like peptidoglycan-associated protein